MLRAILAAFALFFPAVAGAASLAQAATSPSQNAYQFSFDSIDGTAMPFSQFMGKVVLVVNTASRCGLTPQYAALQSVYETYKDKGLVVLGVPSNNFAGQEPEDEKTIKAFCDTTYKVTFPMTRKYDVRGDTAHPFYRWAAGQNIGGFLNTAPMWNFHKYIIGRNGQLLHSFGSRTVPDDAAIITAIEKALFAEK